MDTSRKLNISIEISENELKQLFKINDNKQQRQAENNKTRMNKQLYNAIINELINNCY